MRVAVVGVGGVGGYFGGRLAAAGNDVHLMARGQHLEAIRRAGLEVRSVAGDFHVRPPATDDPAEVGPVDLVLVCVKSYDTEPVARSIGPMVGEGTGVLSLQNGVDNEEVLAAAVGPDHVLGGAAFIFARITGPGVVTHVGGPGRITIGELSGSRSERVERFAERFDEAGVPAEVSDDVRAVLWSKLAFICAQAGLTAGVRLPIGELREVPETMDLFRRIVEEVMAVARAEGVELPADLVERHEEFARSLEPGSYASLYDDLVAGRRMELEALHGSVVGRARRHGVDVPACQAVYAILRPWALRNERGAEPAGGQEMASG